jgi:hypothetical protein
MKWRAFSRMPQWVRLSEWLGISLTFELTGPLRYVAKGPE